MPDEDDEDYVYGSLPAGEETAPPLLADDELWHLFCHPKASFNNGVYDSECRNRLPKRLKPLEFTANQGYPVGWAVEFVEGLNWRFFAQCESVIGLIALIFPIIWVRCTSRDDRVVVAFTIAVWIFGGGQALYGVLLILSEAFCFWRY